MGKMTTRMRWEEARNAACERSPGRRLFRKVWGKEWSSWPRPEDRASCCRGICSSWDFRDNVEVHLWTLKHFRIWCMEHPDQVAERFPEALELVTEAILLGEGAKREGKKVLAS